MQNFGLGRTIGILGGLAGLGMGYALADIRRMRRFAAHVVPFFA